MVGPARFELATSTPPVWRATRLRYGPTGKAMLNATNEKTILFVHLLLNLEHDGCKIVRLLVRRLMGAAGLMQFRNNC